MVRYLARKHGKRKQGRQGRQKLLYPEYIAKFLFQYFNILLLNGYQGGKFKKMKFTVKRINKERSELKLN